VDALPLPDAYFDLVINRHSDYAPHELRRVLVPGGRFVTEQVGSRTNQELHDWLGDATPTGTWALDRAVAELEAAGMEVLAQREEFPIARFFDDGAVVYYLKAIAWEIPDFSVDGYFDQLVDVDQRICQAGHVDVTFHHFLITARRP
jgi:SAM-dependent methyltransferase